jgi:leader peptidase (prepilin peptidase)/N-methyltransferase
MPTEPVLIEAILAGVVGLLLGGHATVLSHRLPAGEKVLVKGCHCPRCNAALAIYDQIPVVSWFILSGKCRHCEEPVPARYPIIEATTGLLCFGVGLRYQSPLALFGMLLATVTVLTLAVTDLEHRLIPKKIVYGGLLLVAASLTMSVPWGYGLPPATTTTNLLHAFVAGAIIEGAFFVTHTISPKGLRFGDVRMAGLVGFVLGWISPLAAVVGILIAIGGAVLYGLVVAIHRHSSKVAIPLAPFLATATVAGILAGQNIPNIAMALRH